MRLDDLMNSGVFTFPLLCYGLGTFVTLWLIHWVLWRVVKVRKQFLYLFVVFIGIPTIVFLGGLLSGAPPIDWMLWYMFVFTISGVYVNLYPLFQTGSPTAVMIQKIADRNASGGMTREEILEAMASSKPFELRLRSLEENGLLSGSSGARALSGPGRLLAAFILFYRRLLKLPLGMG